VWGSITAPRPMEEPVHDHQAEPHPNRRRGHGPHPDLAGPTTTTAAPVYPLTGSPVTDAAAARRPALSVKIDNVAGSFPQVGVDHADMVAKAKALVEGGLTRLLATCQSHEAPEVGPIRSARPVDAALLRELGGGIFAHSGAAAGDIAPVQASSSATLLSFDAGVTAFHRDYSRPSHPQGIRLHVRPAGGRAGRRGRRRGTHPSCSPTPPSPGAARPER